MLYAPLTDDCLSWNNKFLIQDEEHALLQPACLALWFRISGITDAWHVKPQGHKTGGHFQMLQALHAFPPT